MLLFCGDCLQYLDVVPDKSVDMVLCDLPYGTTACKWDKQIDMTELWKHYNRVLKDNGSVLLFGCEPFSTMLRMSNMQHYKYDWYWIKNRTTGFQHARNRPLVRVETVSVFSNAPMGHVSLLGDKRMTYNPQGIVAGNEKKITGKEHVGILGARPNQVGRIYQQFNNFPSNVLEFSKDAKCIHPTQKPVELLEYLIKTYTNAGNVVLDNCMGSGSTGVACVNTGRHFIGIEKDKKFFEMAKDRIFKRMVEHAVVK